MNNSFEPENLPVPEAEKSFPTPDPATSEFDIKPARKTFSRIGWALVLLVVVYSFLQAGVAVAFMYAGNVPGWLELIYLPLLFLPLYAVGVPVYYLFIRKLPRDERLKNRKFSAGGFFAALAFSITAMVVGNLLSTLLMQFINQFLPASPDPIQTLLNASANPWISGLIFCVFAPVFEELIFRKLLIDRVAAYGDGVAILLSGVLFGLFHGNLYQVFYAAFLGMVFAWVYLRSGKLILTIIMHAFINFLGGVLAPYLLALAGGSLSELSSENLIANAAELLPKVLPIIAYELLVFGVSIAGLVIFLRKRKALALAPSVQAFPKGRRFSAAILNSGMIVAIVIMLAIFIVPFVYK